MQEDDAATVSHCCRPPSDDNRVVVASFPASGKFDRVRVTSRDDVTIASSDAGRVVDNCAFSSSRLMGRIQRSDIHEPTGNRLKSMLSENVMRKLTRVTTVPGRRRPIRHQNDAIRLYNCASRQQQLERRRRNRRAC